MPSQQTLRYWNLIRETATRHGLNPLLLAGIVDFESGGNAAIRNKSSGATGLGQVMPREAGSQFRDRPTAEQLTDPGVNLEWSARILKSGLDRYGSEDKALASYLGAIDGRGNITGATDANGTGGPAYIRQVRSRMADLAPAVGADVGTVSEARAPAPSGLPRRTVAPASTAGSRPPSAIALQAQQRALQLANSMGRAPFTETTSRVPQSAASSKAQQQAMNLAFGGTYTMPVDGTVTNPYGGKQVYSAGKTTNIGNFNNGTDIAIAAGTVVRAPVGGTVTKVYNTKNDDRAGQRNAEENSGWGGQVVIKGDDGAEHRLSHAQFGSIIVQPGQRVEEGQPTHKVGMSGNATGPHVDWEKWVDGKSVDPLKAPLQPSTAGAKAYAAALTRLRALTPDSGGTNAATDQAPATDTSTAAASGDPTAGTGATSVSQTAGAPNQQLVSTYQGLQAQTAKRLQTQRLQMDEYQRELVGLQQRLAGGDKSVQTRIASLQGQPDKPGTGLIGKLNDDIQDTQDRVEEYQVKAAQAQTVAAGKTLTPEELEQTQAQTAKIKAETEALRKRLTGEDLSPLERAKVEGDIAAQEAEITLRDRAQTLNEQELRLKAQAQPSQIRATEAGAAANEWQIAESAAMLPYNIDRVLSQTDVDSATADKIRQLLPAEVEGAWTDIWAKQQLTPNEVELGKANIDLTRQRVDEIRRNIGPNIERTLAAAGVDRATIARMTQMLPLELANTAAETQLRQSQTGLTNQQERRAKTEADILNRREQGWRQYVDWAKGNPDASDEQRNGMLMGLVQDVQDYAALYRNQLDKEIAVSGQQERLQERQIAQQQADTQQFSASETAAGNLRQNLTQNVANLPSVFGGEANLSGPQGRFAALAGAGAMGGEEAARGLAAASSWGTNELSGVSAGLRAFQDQLKRIQGFAPQGGIRAAPNVSAPNPISVRFTPPTSLGGTPPNMPMTPPAPANEVAPQRQNPEGMDVQDMGAGLGTAFIPPGSEMTDEQRRMGLRRIGGV